MVEIFSLIIQLMVIWGGYAASLMWARPIGALLAGAKEGDLFVLGGSHIFISLITVLIAHFLWQFLLGYILSRREKAMTSKKTTTTSSKKEGYSIRELVNMVLDTKYKKVFFIALVISLCLCLMNGVKINHDSITHTKFFSKTTYNLSDIDQIDITVTLNLKNKLFCEINLWLENTRFEIWQDSLRQSPRSEELIRCLELIIERNPAVRITYNYEPTEAILARRSGTSKQAIIDIYNWAISHNAIRVE